MSLVMISTKKEGVTAISITMFYHCQQETRINGTNTKGAHGAIVVPQP